MSFLVPFLLKKVIHLSFSCVFFFFLRRVDLTVLLIVGASFTSCISPQRTHHLLLSDASGCIKALKERRNYEVELSRKYILNIQNSSFFFLKVLNACFFLFSFSPSFVWEGTSKECHLSYCFTFLLLIHVCFMPENGSCSSASFFKCFSS